MVCKRVHVHPKHTLSQSINHIQFHYQMKGFIFMYRVTVLCSWYSSAAKNLTHMESVNVCLFQLHERCFVQRLFSSGAVAPKEWCYEYLVWLTVWLISESATTRPNSEESSDPADGAENLPDCSNLEHTNAEVEGQKEPEESRNGCVLPNGVWSAGDDGVDFQLQASTSL